MNGNETKLFFNPLVKRLIESFSFCFDVKITFYSLTMDEWLVGFHNSTSDYCTMIQQKLKIRYRCMKQDSMMCEKCRRIGRGFCYQCHGGLRETLIPIILEGKMTAIAMVGQFRMADEPPKLIQNEWRERGYPERELRKAFIDRPLFTEEKLEKMQYIFSTFLQFLINTQNMTIRKPELVERVLSYIDGHIAQTISLSQVASALDKSTSTITHTLKTQLDTSFKQTVIMRKIQKFEQFINRDPTLPISQACRMVGYDDPLYFSRLYRVKRGNPPSEYISIVQRARRMSEVDTKALLE